MVLYVDTIDACSLDLNVKCDVSAVFFWEKIIRNMKTTVLTSNEAQTIWPLSANDIKQQQWAVL